MPSHPPRLNIQTVIVRATVKDGRKAMVYTVDGYEIPSDRWDRVPISPTIAIALKAGDLEQAEGTENDLRPLTRQEIEQKYGLGPLQARAIHRRFRPATRREQSTEETQHPPAFTERGQGRPKGTSKQVRQENEQVASLINGGMKPNRAYKQVAAKTVGDDAALLENKRLAVERNYQRWLKGPTKRPKQPIPTK
jgi:hypothetical protein